MVAPGDIDLVTFDAVVIAFGDRPRLDRPEIRAGLRFGQDHRAGPFARNELREVPGLQFFAAVFLEGHGGIARQHRQQ